MRPNEFDYLWVMERIAGELKKRKLEFKIGFERSNYDIDLILAVRVEKVQCPTCFSDTHWRSSMDLCVERTNIVNFNKLPKERQEKEIEFFMSRVDKATRRV